ncbi:MAG: phosphatidate cytidylyltransferase [Actinobacteria bacterium]|nr:phosphatidate cytidylyltransferase [Actinomycetota bacterium]
MVSRRAEPRAAEDADAPAGGRNLPIAVASGVLLAAVMIGSILWHPAAFTLLVAVLCLIAVVEVGQVLRARGIPIAVPVLLVATVVLLFGAYRGGAPGQVIGVLTLFLGAVAWELADGARRDVVRSLSSTLLIGLWVPFLATYGVLLVHRPVDGPAATLAVLGGAIFTDIGGYFVGTRFGRHKVAPSVSPAKSWEGLIGGLVLSGLVGALILPLMGDLFDVTTAILVPVLAGLAAFVGDLTESMVKRDLGVKDLGALIPGHGGILDRVDGIVFALPVGYYVIEVLR